MESTLPDALIAKRLGFWARQFGPNPTRVQDAFDVTFGLVLPIICFLLDPIVFKSPAILGRPVLEDYQLLAYLVSTVEMGFFLVWRTFREKVNAFSSLFAGIFWTGAIFSALIGFVILPFTLLGLLYVIGVLGFIPFLSAFVYLRNGTRAINAQANQPISLRFSSALSGVFVVGALVLANMYVESAMSASVETLITGNVIETRAAAAQLKYFPFIPSKHLDRISIAYENELNPIKQQALKEAYKEITGDEIKPRMLFD